MDLDEVIKLLELMESHELEEVEVAQGDVHIRLKKSRAPALPPLTAIPMPALPVGGAPVVPQAAPAAAPEPKEDTVEITSPMVGTFYRAASPQADAFINEGDTITADSVVCIIEAMKVMNEIRAEVEGEVIRVLVENGESVEFGQPLMVIRPSNPSK